MASNRVFRLTGDWEIASVSLRNMVKMVTKAVVVTNMQLGLFAEGRAKKHMRDQDLGWAELAPSTVARKIRTGGSNKTLIDTSTYFQSITSWSGDGVTNVGVRRTVRDEDGEVVANIAAIHEYGGGNTPARPLWHPVLEEVKQKAQSGLLSDNIKKEIDKFKARTNR